jgi:malonate transporter
METILFALAPVVLLILLGFMAGRLNWVDAPGSAQISRLCFSLLSPALLFRTMSRIEIQITDLIPVVAYFIAILAIFAGTAIALGRNTRSIVMALASTYGNIVMIGIPLITLAFGQEGLVSLFALLSVHSLILLTLSTVCLEWARVREMRIADPGAAAPRRLPVVMRALRNSIINPVVLPIAAGLIWSQTGWTIPMVLDRPLQWMGQAFSPLALLLVGISLAQLMARPRGDSDAVGMEDSQRGASGAAPKATIAVRLTLMIILNKNLLHPLLVAGLCALFGIQGLAAVVIVVAAALPTGATVFMFSQRYGVARDQVASAVAASTVLALVGLPFAMLLATALFQ